MSRLLRKATSFVGRTVCLLAPPVGIFTGYSQSVLALRGPAADVMMLQFRRKEHVLISCPAVQSEYRFLVALAEKLGQPIQTHLQHPPPRGCGCLSGRIRDALTCRRVSLTRMGTAEVHGLA